VRRDDSTFASESRNIKVKANGRGPIATAARTGEEQVVTNTTTMVRADLAKEFSIKRITFVPLTSGQVLEYGTPSPEEVVYLQLLALLIYELVHSASIFGFFQLFIELIAVLRLVAVVEGPSQIASGIRKSLGSFMEGTNALEVKMESGVKTAQKKRFVVLRLAMKPISYTIAMATFGAEAYSQWQRSREERAAEVLK